MKVMDGGGDTFRHLYTYKSKNKMNTNFAFMNEVVKAKDRQGKWRAITKEYFIILSMQLEKNR